MPAYLTKKQVEHNNCIDCPNLQVFYERKYWRTVNVSLYEKPLRTIDGSFCKESQKVGYCKCDLHRGFLTKNLMEEHDCLGKECIWFVKDENAPYWQYKAKKKEARKTGKALKKEIATKEKYYLEKMRELTREDSDFYIVNVEWNEKEKQYDVRVITFAFIDFPYYVSKFKKACDNIDFKFMPIKASYDKKREIIEVQKIKKVSPSKEEPVINDNATESLVAETSEVVLTPIDTPATEEKENVIALDSCTTEKDTVEVKTETKGIQNKLFTFIKKLIRK